MAPKKSDGEGKAKPTTVTTPVRQTRSMDRKTRSQTRHDSPGGGSSSSKLFTFESPEKKKRKPKAKDAGPATKKIKQEKEDDDDVAAAKEEGDDGAEHKRIVIEHCKQCKSFKERANELKDGLEIAVPGIIVTVNADKPRRGCFEIREEGGQTFVSLLDMKRPFKEMKDLDMEQVIADIVEKLK
ncbi:hypothetical protein HID58_062193 [Brassica napus]|uniref:BnaC04g36410D protein n=2 Tax=Brassica napus TaxID=3708 RepID=A0A078G182_BRANA|nr:selenoprotein H [Brassica napus]KAH0886097.1 hypothetical protein HID58_062193 [Brassica napus]CAF1861480.1 unnamed protein product [Brassica napus]CDY20315.1 BnaC04g36410D [Brassica napus]